MLADRRHPDPRGAREARGHLPSDKRRLRPWGERDEDWAHPMTPDEFFAAVHGLGYEMTPDDGEDTPIAWWHKLCHKLDCSPRWREFFMAQEELYGEPHVLAKQFDEIVRRDCGHGSFLPHAGPALPPPTL